MRRNPVVSFRRKRPEVIREGIDGVNDCKYHNDNYLFFLRHYN
jgi:hypothetical protein